MEMIKLKPGPKGRPLENEKKERLLRIITSELITLDTMAKRIKITKRQLEYPLTAGGNCSPLSYRKITRFLEKVKP